MSSRPDERVAAERAQAGQHARQTEEVSSPNAPLQGLALERELVEAPDREFTVAARSQWSMVVRRFLRHRLAVVSLAVFIAVVLLAFVGGALWHYSYQQYTNDYSVSPSLKHPFGTDSSSFDTFAQVLRGTQRSLEIALFVAIVSTAIGTIYGAIAGFFRGISDSIMMRIVDLFLTFPIIAVAAILGGHVTVGTSGLAEMEEFIKTGKLRAIAITSPQRLQGVAISTLKEQGVPRDERLRALARLQGVYVPSLYSTHVESEHGFEVVTRPVDATIPYPVGRSVIPDLDKYPFPDDGPIGGPEAIFDRMSIEIARGYLRLVPESPARDRLWATIEEEHTRTVEAVLDECRFGTVAQSRHPFESLSQFRGKKDRIPPL